MYIACFGHLWEDLKMDEQLAMESWITWKLLALGTFEKTLKSS